MIGKYYVIDSHTHVYPERIAKMAREAVDDMYDLRSVHSGTAYDLRKTMEADGVDHCIISNVATGARHVKFTNDMTAKHVRENGGAFTGLGGMHQDSEDLDADAAYIKELGLAGVKIHPDIQKFRIDDEKGLALLEAIYKAGLPVLIHTGDRRYDYSNIDRLAHALDLFPDMTVIGGHFGAYTIWSSEIKKLAGRKNFYVDCSSTFFAVSDARVKEMIDIYGTDHVLFGSDYPVWDAAVDAERLLSLGYPEADYERIFSENAKKVFDI